MDKVIEYAAYVVLICSGLANLMPERRDGGVLSRFAWVVDFFAWNWFVQKRKATNQPTNRRARFHNSAGLALFLMLTGCAAVPTPVAKVETTAKASPPCCTMECRRAQRLLAEKADASGGEQLAQLSPCAGRRS